MNFAERLAEDARNAVGTDEKRITAAEFDDAVKQVMKQMTDDERITDAASVLMPLIGSIFASDMRRILFGEDE